jgi:hypothetical protein
MVPFNEIVMCDWWHVKKQRSMQYTEAGVERLRMFWLLCCEYGCRDYASSGSSGHVQNMPAVESNDG